MTIIAIENYPFVVPNELCDSHDYSIAGGSVLAALTNGEVNDYDVYPKSKQAAKDIVEVLYNSSELINVSTKAITFLSYENNKEGRRIPIQVMAFDEFSTPEKVFENFDFTVCMVAVDDKGTLFYDQQGMLDIAKRNITFNPKTLFPLASLVRLDKYKRKGYHVSNATTTAVGFAASAKGLPNSWEEAQNLIGGFYGRCLAIKAEQNVPFNLGNLINSLYETDKYESFSMLPKSVNELLYAIDPTPIPHTYLNGVAIEVKKDNILGSPLSFEVFAKGEVINLPLVKSYKYAVLHADGKITSQYKSTFEYKLGSVVSSTKHPYLFSSKVIDLYKKARGVLLEVYTLPEFIRKYDYTHDHAILQSEHLFVNRIVPENEVASIKSKELVQFENLNDGNTHAYIELRKVSAPVPVVPNYPNIFDIPMPVHPYIPPAINTPIGLPSDFKWK